MGYAESRNSNTISMKPLKAIAGFGICAEDQTHKRVLNMRLFKV
jgi:hypothetical protein